MEARPLLAHAVRMLLPMTILGTALVGLAAASGGGGPTETSTFLMRIGGGVVLSAAAIAMVLALARRPRSRDVPAEGAGPLGPVWRPLVIGALLWLVPAAGSFLILGLLGMPLGLEASPGRVVTVVLLVLGAVLLSEAVPEEIVFREYLMSVLGERLPVWWALIVQAVLFTAFGMVLTVVVGGGGIDPSDLSLFLGMGIGLGYLRIASGSVWTTVGFHAGFQTGSQLVLTHDVITVAGSTTTTFIALGAIPFTVGAVLVAVIAPKHPQLFAPRG